MGEGRDGDPRMPEVCPQHLQQEQVLQLLPVEGGSLGVGDRAEQGEPEDLQVRLSVCGAGLGLCQPGQQVNKKIVFPFLKHRCIELFELCTVQYDMYEHVINCIIQQKHAKKIFYIYNEIKINYILDVREEKHNKI